MKRIAAVLFAISALTATSVKAADAPAWVVAKYNAGSRCEKWEPLFRKHGLPVVLFSYISFRESRCRPGAVNAKWRDGKIVWTLNKNGTYDSGILQINSSWRTVTRNVCGGGLDRLFDPVCNVKVAAFLYHDSGAGHWGFKGY